MKVEKTGCATDPGYPSRRQFSQYQRLLVGMAAIGLGAAVGQGQEGRLKGDVAVEPREPKPAATKPVTTMGKMRAEPGTSCTATNLPSASTNQAPSTAKVPAPACTNKASCALRMPGEMPAQPK